MADQTAAQQQRMAQLQKIMYQNAAQDLFLQTAIPRRQRVGIKPYVDGGTTAWDLPQSGLASCLMVTVRGTITVAGSITAGTWKAGPNPFPWGIIKSLQLASNQSLLLRSMSGWSNYKWLRNRYGFDPLAALGTQYASAASASLGAGVAPQIVPGANVTAATYTVAMSFPVPISYNSRQTAGMLILQSNAVKYTLSLNWAQITSGISATGPSTNDAFDNLTGTGISVTTNLNATVDIETYDIAHDMTPSLSLYMCVNEQVQSPLVQGVNEFRIPNGDLYTTLMLEFVNNNVRMPHSQLANVQFSYAGNNLRYDEDYDTKTAFDLWQKNVLPTDGNFIWDLGLRNGLTDQRDIFDAFNSAQVTNLLVRATIPATVAVTGINQMTLVTESLRTANQSY